MRPLGWDLTELGGQGDCAFRVVAHHLAGAQKKTLTPDELIREASRLRLLAVEHLRKHREEFKDRFSPDIDVDFCEGVSATKVWGEQAPPQLLMNTCWRLVAEMCGQTDSCSKVSAVDWEPPLWFGFSTLFRTLGIDQSSHINNRMECSSLTPRRRNLLSWCLATIILEPLSKMTMRFRNLGLALPL